MKRDADIRNNLYAGTSGGQGEVDRSASICPGVQEHRELFGIDGEPFEFERQSSMNLIPTAMELTRR